MSKVWFRNALRGVALVALGVALIGESATAVPRPAAKRRALDLFAGVLGRMNVNRFDCGLDAFGKVCVDPFGSSTVGGGYWPKGTPDGYVFNSGLQLAGIVDPAAAFAWANDTVGAFFFDAKGTTEHGDRLSLVWNSLDPSDNANWPRDAYVPNDPTLYDPVLIGRKAASQQDSWIQYWDGNPAFNGGRKHPLGVLVTQRGMAWNFPTGNEDIIYYIYYFTNITASDPAVYAGLPDADTLASLGARFQALNEAAFGLNIPDGGYAITNMYASFSMDADVSDAARENYSTAFIPFNMGTAFKSNWDAPEMVFTPASTFAPPFAAAPGVVGVKYLRSPIVGGSEVGLTMFSNTINGGQFDDAQNATQLWRYLSAKLNPAAGDAPCNAPLPPNVGKVCYVSQTADDIRFFQSSGPLNLAPGETQVIVVAYIAAAPVNDPAIANRSPAFDLKPAFPAQPNALATGADTLRSVDRVFGAVSVADANADGVIDQNEVETVDRSLLNKGLVAQAVFDGKFLLPFPPDAPEFFVVPGNNQVTVVWRQSATEMVGDPYFQIASLPTVPDPGDPSQQIPNALYDPNYREFDVEGYRVYRGRTSGDLTLVAQFDYTGREIIDYTGAFDYGNCAPELGVTTDCPVDFSSGMDSVAHPLVGNVVQVPPGGRVELASGDILILAADTAVTGGASGNPPLSDNGVPFAFVDRSVRNSFRYYYSVVAFDANSVKSVTPGYTALESARITKEVTPRAGSGQQTAGNLATQQLIDAAGQPIPAGTQPTINAATGIFSGPSRPANGVQLGLAAFLPEILGSGSVTLTIDSVSPGSALALPPVPATYYLTAQGSGAPSQGSFPVQFDAFDEDQSGNTVFQATPIDGSKAARYGGTDEFQIYGSVDVEVPGTWKISGWARGNINGAPPLSDYNGPRWWAGAANENTADPVGLQCPGSPGGCVQADLSRNAGSLPGVDVLFRPAAYGTVNSVPMRDFEGMTSNVTRAADFAVTWGAGGTIASVVDLVHRVPVPFHSGIRGSWGILNGASFGSTDQPSTPDANNGLLTWSDIFCVEPAPLLIGQCGATSAPLMNQAQLSPVAATASAFADAGTLSATGNGFIFYLNGHFFLMQMTALPADGTVWYARFYSGTVIGAPGSYSFVQETRPPAVTGLRVQVAYDGSTFDPMTTADGALDNVHTVPDPYYVTSAFEQSPANKILRFVNLPSRCIIRIYSQSGILVNAITLDDPTGGGELTWNLRNRNNQFVASGVYFYHVETPDGKTKVGRFTIVNFAQ